MREIKKHYIPICVGTFQRMGESLSLVSVAFYYFMRMRNRRTSRVCTESMNLRRSGLTSSGFKRWSTLPSLPLFFQPQEVWAMKPPPSTSVWHRCSLRNGISPYACVLQFCPYNLISYVKSRGCGAGVALAQIYDSTTRDYTCT